MARCTGVCSDVVAHTDSCHTMTKPLAVSVCVLLGLMVGGADAIAQDIEPRAYSNAPIGVNFLAAGYARTDGGLSTDGSLPLTDINLRTDSAVLGMAHVLEIGGQSAKIDLIAPYTRLSGDAKLDGAPIDRNVDGFADPKVRLSVNLYGAPALTLRDFANYRQDLIVGVSLQASLPVGQYDDDRLVNIGTNRWAFRPEVGVSKASGRWTLELAAGATIYTDNDNFYGGKRREQDPIYSMQGHLIYSFHNGWWASGDATYFEGGRTTIDGVHKNDQQKNWRGGLTLAIPIDRLNSVKLYASNGVSARTGNEFDLYGVAWQYRWGAGL
jgi:hypothetical protein